eukprot:4161572-Prymnesium_polylepis.1
MWYVPPCAAHPSLKIPSAPVPAPPLRPPAQSVCAASAAAPPFTPVRDADVGPAFRAADERMRVKMMQEIQAKLARLPFCKEGLAHGHGTHSAHIECSS